MWNAPKIFVSIRPAFSWVVQPSFEHRNQCKIHINVHNNVNNGWDAYEHWILKFIHARLRNNCCIRININFRNTLNQHITHNFAFHGAYSEAEYHLLTHGCACLICTEYIHIVYQKGRNTPANMLIPAARVAAYGIPNPSIYLFIAIIQQTPHTMSYITAGHYFHTHSSYRGYYSISIFTSSSYTIIQ